MIVIFTQKQCKEVSTREKCHPVTTGESKTVLYRKQSHNITDEVDGLLDRVTEETKEPARGWGKAGHRTCWRRRRRSTSCRTERNP